MTRRRQVVGPRLRRLLIAVLFLFALSGIVVNDSLVLVAAANDFRKQGLSIRILDAVTAYVKKQGGKIVEGYPVEPRKGKTADAFAWTGLASAYIRAGFVECTRRSENRPIMRYHIK